MQGFIDQEFGCRNPKCPKCDHEFTEVTKGLQDLLKQIANLPKDDPR